MSRNRFFSIYSSSRLSKELGSIHIPADNAPLDNVDSYTYLGVVINNQFPWNDHGDYICGKISNKFGLILPPLQSQNYVC